MMDFLAKLFNPGGPMDLATGQRAAPSGTQMLQGLGKGAEALSIGADAIGGTPHQQRPMGGGLDAILQQLKQRQQPQQPQQSPMEQLLQRLFGMKPTNPVSPSMGPTGTQIPLNTNGPRGGTGGLY